MPFFGNQEFDNIPKVIQVYRLKILFFYLLQDTLIHFHQEESEILEKYLLDGFFSSDRIKSSAP